MVWSNLQGHHVRNTERSSKRHFVANVLPTVTWQSSTQICSLAHFPGWCKTGCSSTNNSSMKYNTIPTLFISYLRSQCCIGGLYSKRWIFKRPAVFKCFENKTYTIHWPWAESTKLTFYLCWFIVFMLAWVITEWVCVWGCTGEFGHASLHVLRQSYTTWILH